MRGGSTQFLLAAVVMLLLVVLGPPAEAVEVQQVKAGGVEAWLVEEHATPMISIAVAIRGGADTDPAGKEGRALMAAGLLNEGAGDDDARTFQTRLEKLAIRMNAQTRQDAVIVTLQTLTRNREEAFRMLGEALSAPRFDPDAVERVRGQMLAMLRQKAQDPRYLARRKLLATLFPHHPYGRPKDGTPETVAALTPDDMHAFARERFARDALVIGVVGDITAEELAPLLETAFGALPPKAAPTGVPDTTAHADGSVAVIDVDVPQSVVALGAPGPLRNDPDWYAALVMNHVLGGGSFTSRLYHEVREQRGLVYGVYTYLLPRLHAGLIQGGAATANERVGETLALIRGEWERMAQGGVTDEEVEHAKTFLVGSFPLRFTRSSHIAAMLVAMQLADLSPDYIDRYPDLVDAVTKADVERAARTWLRPDTLTAVVAGRPVGLEPTN